MWGYQHLPILELTCAIYIIKESNVNNHKYFVIQIAFTSPAFIVCCSNTPKDSCSGCSSGHSPHLDINPASSSFRILHLWSGQKWEKHYLPLSSQRWRSSILYISFIFILTVSPYSPTPWKRFLFDQRHKVGLGKAHIKDTRAIYSG